MRQRLPPTLGAAEFEGIRTRTVSKNTVNSRLPKPGFRVFAPLKWLEAAQCARVQSETVLTSQTASRGGSRALFRRLRGAG